jgi:RPA family protein
MKVDKKMEKRWEIESAMSTLQRAEDIKKNPTLMRDVRKAAKTQAAQLMKLGGPVSKKSSKPVPRKKKKK